MDPLSPEAALALLLPRAKKTRLRDAAMSLPEAIGVAVAASDPALATELFARTEQSLGPLGLRLERREAGTEAAIRVWLEPGQHRPQSYRLKIGGGPIDLRGADPPGLFYGLQTLRQWLELTTATGAPARRVVPGLEVDDHPDFLHRGVMLDISRNRVPRRDALLRLVDRLARLKINQLQLYTEHTFAYTGHERIWEGWSPLLPEEVRELDAFCRARYVELVPNQNSFGHLHRWLVHEPYRRLAECPAGLEHPWSVEPEPFSLCPIDPGSLRLLEDLYDQLLPNFSSRQFNVGLDETLDLGRGRSAEACRERGSTTVYLEFLAAVHRLVSERGFRMQFWGDVILEAPERIAELSADVIALEWGYEADHPFAEHALAFARSGREFYVCPGTSSWASLTGRWDNALANLDAAARCGLSAGAAGLLVTDWGDFGHLQPPPVSELGLLLGADRAWTAEAGADRAEALLACWAFGDDSAGAGERLARAARQLGSAYRLTGAPWRNGSPLFRLLQYSDQSLEHPRFRGLSRQGLLAAAELIEEGLAALPEGPLAARELRWAGELLGVGARLGLARLAAGIGAPTRALPAAAREPLATELERLVSELEPLWLERSRPGGLVASQRLLLSWRNPLSG